MKKYFLYIISLLLFNEAISQLPVYQNSFDSLPSSYTKTRGIQGNCLNLSPTASFRQPLIIENDLVQCKGNFTVMVWIKASGTKQSYSILASRYSSKESDYGWDIGLQASGVWCFKAWTSTAKDTIQYDYTPAPGKQLINENGWHQLAFSYDSLKNELSFFCDGLNKAIFHTPGLKNFTADKLLIGGNSQGVRDEWETFNGAIDELKIFNVVLPASDINKEYTRLMPQAIKKTNGSATNEFSVMNYNIFHGGHETGKEVGVQRIVDIIKTSGADIISMQETYGSGPAIADELGFYFYLRSTNLAIFSRYPIESSLPGGRPFNNGGVLINIPGGRKLAFYTNWLNYPFDYWDMLEKGLAIDSAYWHHMQDSVNAETLRNTLKFISPFISTAENIPVIFCGDLNTGSHLDWTEATRHLNNGYVMPFPATKIMEQQGFTDSYREVHTDPVKDRGITWSPMFQTAFKDRIDYIFYKSNQLKPVQSAVIDTHPVRYPSDHGAVVTKFVWKK